MYVTVYNTQCGCNVNYEVTNSRNIVREVSLPAGYVVFERDVDEWFPVTQKEEFKIRKTNVKPSVYKRDFLDCYKSRYDYAFTETKTKTVTEERDVYYSEDKDKFYRTTPKVHTTKKTVYDLPHLIIF
jgi:hypothetical protein